MLLLQINPHDLKSIKGAIFCLIKSLSDLQSSLDSAGVLRIICHNTCFALTNPSPRTKGLAVRIFTSATNE